MKKISAITIAIVTSAMIGYGIFHLDSATASSKGVNVSSSPSYPSFGVDLPWDYEVHGIDVSRHQRDIDWEAVSKMRHKDVSISFAFIKASEGKSISDEYFKDNWKEAKKHGLMRGAYHFYRPHLPAEVQAELFFSQLKKLEPGDLPPVLDIEMKGSTKPEVLKRNLKRWLTLVEKKYGVTPIIYTSYSFYNHYLRGKEFKKYPLWIAHYRTPDLKEKMNDWHFWQHSDRGYVNGIRGTVDFNVFNGKSSELKELCKK